MKILVYGIGGAMGHNVVNAAKESKDIEVVCGVDKFYAGNDLPCPVYPSCAEIKDKIDCIVDFSVPQAIYDYLPYAVENKIPCVIATTGYAEKDEEYIKKASERIAILKSGNLSMGINLLLHLSKEAAKSVGSQADIE
ncbi:MAG: 4-hydroxy-tetrahydrodipicolinate reductase, partial [Clostridia bacterium]|nr:4-hydroxy-tetrahydrodipicolinate reductase [Clostridia bacterium]